MAEEGRGGRIVGVNGNMVTVEFDTSVRQNEVAYVLSGDVRLMAEVIRVRNRYADLQVFEETHGLVVGGRVEFSGELLSVELGPGLLGIIVDGLQNPSVRSNDYPAWFAPAATFRRTTRRVDWGMTQSVACVYNVHDIQDLRVASIQPEIAGSIPPLCLGVSHTMSPQYWESIGFP